MPRFSPAKRAAPPHISAHTHFLSVLHLFPVKVNSLPFCGRHPQRRDPPLAFLSTFYFLPTPPPQPQQHHRPTTNSPRGFFVLGLASLHRPASFDTHPRLHPPISHTWNLPFPLKVNTHGMRNHGLLGDDVPTICFKFWLQFFSRFCK